MKTTSTAYLRVQTTKEKYVFDGVVSITHALTLKVSTDSDSSTGADYVNNARNEPDVVTLSVAASDVNPAVKHGNRATVQALAEIKEKRLLCRLVTNLRSYKNMLLTDLSVLQDETCPCGWTGTLTFTQVEPATPASNPQDNSSTPTSTGNTAPSGGSSPSSPSGSETPTHGDNGLTYFSHIMNHAAIMY